VKILMFSRKIDYLTIGSNFVSENDKTKTSEFKWGTEIICHYRLNGGNPKNYGVSSNEEPEEEEPEEEDLEEGKIRI
jgi:hypothetical protein